VILGVFASIVPFSDRNQYQSVTGKQSWPHLKAESDATPGRPS
jgi:hypothetical protein